jgi:hypothetical protein
MHGNPAMKVLLLVVCGVMAAAMPSPVVTPAATAKARKLLSDGE